MYVFVSRGTGKDSICNSKIKYVMKCKQVKKKSLNRVSGLQKHTWFNCRICFSFRPQPKISTWTSGKTETHNFGAWRTAWIQFSDGSNINFGNIKWHVIITSYIFLSYLSTFVLWSHSCINLCSKCVCRDFWRQGFNSVNEINDWLMNGKKNDPWFLLDEMIRDFFVSPPPLPRVNCWYWSTKLNFIPYFSTYMTTPLTKLKWKWMLICHKPHWLISNYTRSV